MIKGKGIDGSTGRGCGAEKVCNATLAYMKHSPHTAFGVGDLEQVR